MRAGLRNATQDRRRIRRWWTAAFLSVATLACDVPTFEGPQLQSPPQGFLMVDGSQPIRQMVSGLTVGRKKYAAVETEMKELGLKAAGLVHELQKLVERDALAYGEVTTAYKLPKDTDEQNAARTKAIDDALVGAAQHVVLGVLDDGVHRVLLGRGRDRQVVIALDSRGVVWVDGGSPAAGPGALVPHRVVGGPDPGPVQLHRLAVMTDEQAVTSYPGVDHVSVDLSDA